MQEWGLLLALWVVLDPCTPTPGQTSRLAQPPPLHWVSRLALPWSCMGTAGRWAGQPLGLASLGHPDEHRGWLVAEMSHALSWPCPSVVRGCEPSPGHWLCPGKLLLVLEGWELPCGGVAPEKPCWWDRWRAALSQLVLWSPLQCLLTRDPLLSTPINICLLHCALPAYLGSPRGACVTHGSSHPANVMFIVVEPGVAPASHGALSSATGRTPWVLQPRLCVVPALWVQSCWVPCCSRMAVSHAVRELLGTAPGFPKLVPLRLGFLCGTVPVRHCPVPPASILALAWEQSKRKPLGWVQAPPGRLIPFLGAASGPCCPMWGSSSPSSARRQGIPDQASLRCTAERDCQSLVAYQERIYLKSDNHVVHLVKSSAAWPQPLCLLGARGVCNERQGGHGWHGSGHRIPGLTQPRGDGDKCLQ